MDHANLHVLLGDEYMEKHINVLVIASKACNLDCTYCYRPHAETKNLTYEVFEKYIKNMDSFFPPETQISLLFHGGEPLLAGYDFYEKAFEFVSGLDRKFGLGMQTNLTLLDEKTVELFKKYGCGFGTSLDGDDEINSKTRLIKSGNNSSYQIVTDKIQLLKSKGLSVGIISVITEYNMDAKRFYQFVKDIGVWSVTPNPIYEFEESKICTPDIDELSGFMIDLFDLWIKDENPPKIDFFERICHMLLDTIPSRKCVFVKDCTQIMMTIDVDGEVYLCTHWIGKKDYSYGNALTTPFEEIWKSSVRAQMGKRYELVKKKCKDCRFWSMCYGGCMSHAGNDLYDKDYFCEMYKRVFGHIEKALEQALS